MFVELTHWGGSKIDVAISKIVSISDAYDSDATRNGTFKSEVHLDNGKLYQVSESKQVIKEMIKAEQIAGNFMENFNAKV